MITDRRALALIAAYVLLVATVIGMSFQLRQVETHIVEALDNQSQYFQSTACDEALARQDLLVLRLEQERADGEISGQAAKDLLAIVTSFPKAEDCK